MTVRGRRIALAPPEGWLTVGLVLLMCLTLAWSMDDAMLVLGRDAYTDFLPWAAVGGVVAGFVGPIVGWGRWTTYGVGAVFAALILPIVVGTVLPTAGANPGQLFLATADSAANAYVDLIVIGRLTTPQVGHHLLVFGLLVWASSMFASYAVFGHRRPLNAVLLIGVLLVINMSFTVRDQLVYIVLFTLAALFLLIRLHTFEEQSDWLRRRIGDPTALSGMYLRGGTIFIGIAVVGSLLLTRAAASDPLAGAWTNVGSQAIEWSRWLGRYLPQSGTGPVLAPSFGSSASIKGQWSTSNTPAMVIDIPPDLIKQNPYWRVVAYDQLLFDGYAFGEDVVSVDRAEEEPLLQDTREPVTADGRLVVSYTITPLEVGGSQIYAPQSVIAVDVASTLQVVDGADGFFATVDRREGSGPYTVTSSIQLTGDSVEGGLTQNRLRVAGEDYPADIVARYAGPLAPGLIGESARRVLDEIRQLGATNPYDTARNIEGFLRDDANFTYDDNVNDNGDDCTQLSRIECFARFTRGYCEYYASMMTAFLREEGIPARVAAGFLPGKRDLVASTETILFSNAHAWVEVYFPGYGWVDFDPTGGGRAVMPDLPAGRVQPSPSAGASAAAIPTTRPDDSDPTREEPGSIFTPINRGTPVGPLIAAAVLLAVIVGLLAMVAWRRGPRGPVTADGAYGMVTRIASRFGFGPRPNQTVYEYAGTLADILPHARPELETVARAKVEVVYGGRDLEPDRMAALREAQRRLRTSLLRLVTHREERRNRRR